MQLNDLFHKWVPTWVKLPVLLILFFVILTANGVFLGNTTDMYSSLGVYTEPYTMAYNAMYIGMGLALMLTLRLKLRFPNKALLLYGLTSLLLMNIVCATTSNPAVTVGACFILGFTKMTALVEVYIIWMFVWSKTGDSSRMYPFVYLTALGGLYFITWLTTKLAYTYNWRLAYHCIIALVLLCIALTLLFAENAPLKKKVPLYQVDWIGLVLLATSLMLLNYAAVYSKVEDWLNSRSIKLTLAGTLITFGWFVKRELTIKRPIFHFHMLKKPNFRMGLFFFFILGLFMPSSIQSSFSAGILHYESLRNTELNLYMIPGVLAGAILCFYWYYNKYNPQLLIILGFAAFVAYHIIMYNSFANDFNINDFWLPSLVKGFATIVLYIAVGLYTTSKFDLGTITTAAGAMIIVRSFLGSGIFTAAYTWFLYTGRINHLQHLAGLTEANDPLLKEQGQTFYRTMQTQATLTASKEMSGIIIIAGLVLVGLLIVRLVMQQLKSKLQPIT